MDEEVEIFQSKKEPLILCKCLLDQPSSEGIVISERKQQLLTTVSRTESYLRERRIPELIRFLFTKTLAHAPPKPMVYLEKLLDDCMLFRAGHGPAPVIYEKRHITSVIKSFDPGHRGWLSGEQIRQILITLGLTIPDYIDEKMSTDQVLNLVVKIQESELYNLLAAGSNTQQDSEESDSNSLIY